MTIQPKHDTAIFAESCYYRKPTDCWRDSLQLAQVSAAKQTQLAKWYRLPTIQPPSRRPRLSPNSTTWWLTGDRYQVTNRHKKDSFLFIRRLAVTAKLAPHPAGYSAGRHRTPLACSHAARLAQSGCRQITSSQDRHARSSKFGNLSSVNNHDIPRFAIH